MHLTIPAIIIVIINTIAIIIVILAITFVIIIGISITIIIIIIVRTSIGGPTFTQSSEREARACTYERAFGRPRLEDTLARGPPVAQQTRHARAVLCPAHPSRRPLADEAGA